MGISASAFLFRTSGFNSVDPVKVVHPHYTLAQDLSSGWRMTGVEVGCAW